MPFMLALQILIDEEERWCAHREFSLWSLEGGFKIQCYIRASNEFVGSDLRAQCVVSVKSFGWHQGGTIDRRSRAAIGARTAYIHFSCNVRARDVR